MRPVFWHAPLYELLFTCEYYGIVEKSVLDCGCGGPKPPLYIFREQGYKTTGIDISDRSIKSARTFEKEHNIDLNIQKGDMRNLDFEDNSFGLVYSYNTIFHMSKKEINESLLEMIRVLKEGGYLYFNVMTINDDGVKAGEDIGDYEIMDEEHGEKTLHCYHRINEMDDFLIKNSVIIISKSIRKTEYSREDYTSEYIHYICKKVTK